MREDGEIEVEEDFLWLVSEARVSWWPADGSAAETVIVGGDWPLGPVPGVGYAVWVEATRRVEIVARDGARTSLFDEEVTFFGRPQDAYGNSRQPRRQLLRAEGTLVGLIDDEDVLRVHDLATARSWRIEGIGLFEPIEAGSAFVAMEGGVARTQWGPVTYYPADGSAPVAIGEAGLAERDFLGRLIWVEADGQLGLFDPRTGAQHGLPPSATQTLTILADDRFGLFGTPAIWILGQAVMSVALEPHERWLYIPRRRHAARVVVDRRALHRARGVRDGLG